MSIRLVGMVRVIVGRFVMYSRPCKDRNTSMPVCVIKETHSAADSGCIDGGFASPARSINNDCPCPYVVMQKNLLYKNLLPARFSFTFSVTNACLLTQKVKDFGHN